MRILGLLMLLVFLFAPAVNLAASASPGALFTYEGLLTDANGAPITSAQAVVLQIIDSNGTCVLFEESHNVVPGSLGEFSLIVGSGTRQDSTNNSADRIFGVKGTANCSGGSVVNYTGSFTPRYLRVSVGGTVLSPNVTINNVPFAINAARLEDKSANDFVQTSANISQTRAENIFNRYSLLDSLLTLFSTPAGNGQVLIGNGTGFTPATLTAGAGINITNGPGAITISSTGGAGSVTGVTALSPLVVNNGSTTPEISMPAATGSSSGYLTASDWTMFNNKLDKNLSDGKIFVGSPGNVATAVNVTGDASLSNTGALTLSPVGSAATYFKVVTDAKGRVISGAGSLTATDIPDLDWNKITSGKPSTITGYGITDAVNKNGDTMAGALNMDSNNISNAGYILMSPQRALGLGSYSNAQEATLVGSLTAAHKGYTWFNSNDNTIKFWNGSAAQALGLAGSGITSIEGQTGGSQSLAIGSSGNAPAWSSASNTHTLNIPLASSTGVTAGLISKSDYDNFAAKLDATTTFSGDVSGTYNNLTLGTVSISKGGTGQTTASGAFNALSPLTTKGDLLVHNGTASTRLVVGSNGKALVADSAAPEGVKWGDVIATDLLSITGTGIVQRNGAGSYSPVNVNSPLIYSAGALGVSVGTAAGTLAAGDDTRILGALQRSGGTMTGAINMGSNDLTDTGYILMSSQRALGLGAYSNAQETTLIGGLNASHKGYTWFNSDSNQIRFWNGTAAQSLGVAGSGITSFGGQTGGAQSLDIGSSGLAPAWSSASNTHTLNIPMASTPSVTAGLISKSDFDTFNAKQPAGNYLTALTGDISATGPGSVSATIAANAVTTGKIADGTVLGTDLNFSGVNTATTGFVMQDSTGKFFNFACATTGHIPTWTAAGFSCLAPTPLLPSLATGNMWIGNGSNVATAVSMSGDATINTSGALTLASSGVTAGTYSKVTVDLKGRVTTGANIGSSDVTTALGFTPVNKAGDVMTGSLGLGNYTNATEATLITGWGPSDKGKTWFNTTSNQVKYWDGSAAQTVGVSGSGLSALTGDVTATGPGSAAATIAANAVTTGKIADGTILGTDLNYTGVNASTTGFVMKDSTGKFFNFVCATNGHVPTWTASGFACQTPPVSAGTVTSVNGSGAVQVVNSTTNPTISVNEATASSKGIVQPGAGLSVSTGVLAVNPATFASTVPVSKGGTGVTTLPANKLLMGNGSSDALAEFSCALGQIITFNAANIPGCTSYNGAGLLLNGGNNFTAPISIGSNDNQPVTLKTNGLNRFIASTSGSIGVGALDNSTAGILPGLTQIAPQRFLEITGAGTGTPTTYSNGVLLLTNNNGDESAGDELGSIQFGHKNGVYGLYAKIRTDADGVIDGNRGGSIIFMTKTDGGSATATRMKIAHDGNIGIGTISPIEKLHVVGNARIEGNVLHTGSVTNVSDRRLKDDIQTLDNSLQKILEIRGVSYNWKTSSPFNVHLPSGHDIGVIAQEVERVFPEAVVTDNEGLKSVSYTKLIAPVIEATRELHGMCKASEEQIQSFSRRLASLEADAAEKDQRIRKLEEENQNLKKDLELIKAKLGL